MSNLFLVLLLVSFSLLIIGFINPKTSLFWHNKDRTRKKSFLIYFSSIILFFVLFGITHDENKIYYQSNDPLKISNDSIKALIGKKVPSDKWDKWGRPETLEGTNNQYWVAYLDSANVSFVAKKDSDKIIFADFDKNSAIEYITKLKETRKEKINDLLYGNGRNAIHSKLITLVKNDLNDPDSMDNIELSWIDKGSSIIVKMQFTAKNAMGGTIRSSVVVSIDNAGNIIKKLKWIG